MSSILTNTSAMVALQTLKGINSKLSMTQSEISTGKTVASAKDNAAVWAISKVMESDVKGFKGISDSLALGESTVAVARQASETITDLLTNMKGKIVAAQESNVDRVKIQTDVAAIRDQIESVIKAAQFNGLNMINGSSGGDVDILSSLDRASDGTVSVSNITVDEQNLSIGGYTGKDVLAGSEGVSTDMDSAAFFLDKADTTGKAVVLGGGADAFAEGDSISITLGDQKVNYTVSAADAAATTPADMVAVGLKNAIDSLGITDLQVDYDAGSPGTLTFLVANTNGDAATEMTRDLSVSAQFKNAGSGGLGLLEGMDVSTQTGAQTALGNIETLIQTATDAASAFGSVESRISTQRTFISNLSDSMKAGIGAMVDADMEEASARLQALQTQQQLGIQSLSIANQAPQSILSLFR